MVEVLKMRIFSRHNFSVFIKKLCLVLIVCSFFLPIAKGCSHVEVPHQSTPSKTTQETGEIVTPWITFENREPKTRYAWDIIEIVDSEHNPLFIIGFCYLWPLVFLIARRPRNKIWSSLYYCSEIACAVSGMYFIAIVVTFTGAIDLGGYLYLLSALMFLIITLSEIIFKAIQRVQNRRVAKKPI